MEGISSLPKNCLLLSIICFVAAIGINIIQEVLQRYETKYRIYRFIPSPMCMAIPFYRIDMCLGSLIMYLWERSNKNKARNFAPAFMSGLICGDSMWGVPAAILFHAGVHAPIFMKFLSASVNQKVDAFLGGA